MFLLKGADIKYFLFCRPHGLCYNYVKANTTLKLKK